jgi:predicted GNAT family acetyltransferase
MSSVALFSDKLGRGSIPATPREYSNRALLIYRPSRRGRLHFPPAPLSSKITLVRASDFAEMALAHKVGDEVEQAYRRGTALKKRRQLMETWARYVDGNSNVIAMPR